MRRARRGQQAVPGQNGPRIFVSDMQGLARKPEVRADPFQEILERFEIVAAGHDLGLMSRVYETFERFEPIISVSLDLGHPAG
ncbi:MAG: hypothetical protein ACYCXT_06480 [Acidiferrobacteraceae bacterium]